MKRQRGWVNLVVCLTANCVWLLATLFLFPVAIGAEEQQGAFPGVNGKIAFMTNRDGNGEIYVMNANGSGQTRLTSSPGGDRYPAWSPDGTKIAFDSARDGNSEIYVMNFDGSGQTRLTNYPASDSRPAWSPDGTKIAFESYRDGNYEIYVMDAAGTRQERLTNDSGNDDQCASWSPDGTKIAFSKYQYIYVMNANGTGQMPLTGSNGNVDPAWSPDGTRIVFQSGRDGNWEIYVMDADGNGQTRLTSNPFNNNEYPAWSPDGTKIVFHSTRDSNYEIYVMKANGSEQTNLTNHPSTDADPDWQSAPTVQCTLSCSATVPSSGQAGVPAQFTGGANASGTGCGPTSFFWEFGDGQSSTEQSPAHAYLNAGSYGWKMTVSASGATPCTQSGAITINTGPTCSITCSATVPSSGVSGVEVPFVASAQLSAGCSQQITYQWNFGDGGTSTDQNPAHIYLATGTYSWTLTASASGVTPCVSSGTINIAAPGSCVVSCTAKVPATGTVGRAIRFSGGGKTSGNCSSRTVSYKWTFGERGRPSKARRTTHTYRKAGTYQWSLTATASKISAKKGGTITITGGAAACTLTVQATVPSSGVVDVAVKFSANVTKSGGCQRDTAYKWTFGDRGSSTASSPSHTYRELGMYHWTLTVTSGDTVVNRDGWIEIEQR